MSDSSVVGLGLADDVIGLFVILEPMSSCRCLDRKSFIASDFHAALPGLGRRAVNVPHKFSDGLPFARDANRLLEGFFVAGDDLDTLFAASSRDLEQFLGHGFPRNYDCIYGLALRAMSRDYIPMREVFEVCGKRASVLQLDATLFVESGNCDQLAIDSLEPAVAPVGGKQEAIVGSHIDVASLEHVE